MYFGIAQGLSLIVGYTYLAVNEKEAMDKKEAVEVKECVTSGSKVKKM